jgi:hypothetical protein
VIDDDLVLDWATETVVLRIVQEAVRTSGATAGVACRRHHRRDGKVVEVRVSTTGRASTSGSTLFESGIAVMRSSPRPGDGALADRQRAGPGGAGHPGPAGVRADARRRTPSGRPRSVRRAWSAAPQEREPRVGARLGTEAPATPGSVGEA